MVRVLQTQYVSPFVSGVRHEIKFKHYFVKKGVNDSLQMVHFCLHQAVTALNPRKLYKN